MKIIPFLLIPDVVIEGDGFQVSYNNRFNIAGYDSTKLVVGDMKKSYILKGDHRSSYGPLIPLGLDACLAYYVDHLSDAHMLSHKIESAVAHMAPEGDQTQRSPFHL